MCCSEGCLVCFLILVNLIVILACGGAVAVLLWAQLSWDFAVYMSDFGLNSAKTAFYIAYIVLGCVAAVALLGIIACCCSRKILMTIYAILVIIFTIVFAAALLVWIGVFAYVYSHLHETMLTEFKQYKGETGANAQSITFNVLFVMFDTCGVDGPGDFKKYSVTASSLQGLGMLSHPVTCCSEVSSEIETDDLQDNKFTPEDWEALKEKKKEAIQTCEARPNDKGSYPKLKHMITMLFVIVLVLFAVIVLLLIMLACAACSVCKQNRAANRKKEREDASTDELRKLSN